MSVTRCLPWSCLLLGLCLPALAPAATLVQDGKAKAVVVLPPDSDETEKLAARELIEHVEKMSGVRLETAPVDAKDLDRFLEQARKDDKVPVCLGRTALPRLEKAIQARLAVLIAWVAVRWFDGGLGSVWFAFVLTTSPASLLMWRAFRRRIGEYEQGRREFPTVAAPAAH